MYWCRFLFFQNIRSTQTFVQNLDYNSELVVECVYSSAKRELNKNYKKGIYKVKHGINCFSLILCNVRYARATFKDIEEIFVPLSSKFELKSLLHLVYLLEVCFRALILDN